MNEKIVIFEEDRHGYLTKKKEKIVKENTVDINASHVIFDSTVYKVCKRVQKGKTITVFLKELREGEEVFFLLKES